MKAILRITVLVLDVFAITEMFQGRTYLGFLTACVAMAICIFILYF